MLLITDRIGASEARHAARRIVHIDDPDDQDDCRLIVCDVALSTFADMERLRAAIERWRRDADVPLVVMVDRCDPRGHALANALGADRIAPRAAQTRPVSAALVRPPGETPRPAPVASVTPLRTLVDASTTSLKDLFEAARQRRRIDIGTLREGSDALLLALRHNGICDFVEMVRVHDDATFQHSLLVAGLIVAFASRRGMSFASQHLLAQAGLLHDIGKAHVPTAILNKPSALSPAEVKVLRKHPVTGYYMIAHQPGVDPVLLDIVRHHHEYVDGSGYPDGLRGAQISDLCRLVTICDIFGALMERRAYKPPIAPHEAYALLLDMGARLDRGLVSEFWPLVDELNAVGVAA